MKCRRCEDEERVIKSGWIRGKQRWHCKACQFHFVEQQDERCKPEALDQEVVKLYCSGVSYNRSGKLKGVSHRTARRWVSRYAEGLPERPMIKSSVVELDEFLKPLPLLTKLSNFKPLTISSGLPTQLFKHSTP